MTIAQMNWAPMKYPLDDPRMREFSDALAAVFREAELHPGFIWRIPDDQAAQELTALGHNELMSATVSVWKSVADLRDYTFNSRHVVR